MAWFSPLTFTDNEPLTATQLNLHLRDNMNETAPAKATTPGSIFVSDGRNRVSERTPVQDVVTRPETAGMTSFDDLSTFGPSVTTVTGNQAMVFVSCRMKNNTNGFRVMSSFGVSGASEIAPDESWGLKVDGISGGNTCRVSNFHIIRGLTPGENTFYMQYRVVGGSGTWQSRAITVFPL